MQRSATRRWTINGDFAALKGGGVPRYAREVTSALDALVAEEHPLTAGLDLDLVAPCRPGGLQLSAIPVRIVEEYRTPRLPQFWVQAQLPRHVPGGLLSFCNLAPVLVKPHIACIHDLHTALMPESYGRLFRLAHNVVLPLLGRRADAIATVSQLSREHLIAHGVAPASKITVTYNGADHASRWRLEASALELPARRFVFCLGRSQRYKNTELMWRLAAPLDAMGIDIVLAGDIGEAALASFGASRPRNIRYLGRISDDDFAKALSVAVCLLFPSRIEGFGLPAVEAMTLGCPVVASTAPCLPEVCGEAALYADPDDPAAWCDAIGRLARDSELRQRQITQGYARARLYTWRGIAEKYLRLMARIDGVPEQEAPSERSLAR